MRRQAGYWQYATWRGWNSVQKKLFSFCFYCHLTSIFWYATVTLDQGWPWHTAPSLTKGCSTTFHFPALFAPSQSLCQYLYIKSVGCILVCKMAVLFIIHIQPVKVWCVLSFSFVMAPEIRNSCLPKIFSTYKILFHSQKITTSIQ